MHAPTTAQIRTAIQVLKRFGEHINRNAANLIVELPETRLGAHVGDRAKVVSIEQITRIQAVTAHPPLMPARMSRNLSRMISFMPRV